MLHAAPSSLLVWCVCVLVNVTANCHCHYCLRRVAQVQNNRSVSSAAKVVVDEMNVRLRKEMEEREAEAALYSAKLYESERQMSDWWAEARPKAFSAAVL